MWCVFSLKNYDSDPPFTCKLYPTEEEAQKALREAWEDFFNSEVADGAQVDEELTFHEDDYAIFSYDDGDRVEWFAAIAEMGGAR